MRKCTGNNTQDWGFDAIFVLNLSGQRIDSTDTIFDCPYPFAIEHFNSLTDTWSIGNTAH
jgi:hypothetical protein